MSEKEISVDEKEFIRRAQSGDISAFESLAKVYRDSVINVAFGFLRDREDALDIAQEALLKAYRKIESFKNESSFYTWLYRITVNLCKDRLRQLKRRNEIGVEDMGVASQPLEFPDKAPDPRERAGRKERMEIVGAAIDSLPDKHRKVLLLREAGELSYREIAGILGCREGTVMSRLFHARKMLAEKLAVTARDLI